MPIRIRLALGFALVALVVFGVSAVLFERSFHHGVEHSLDPGLRAQAGVLARALRTSETGDLGLNDTGPDALVRTRELVAQVLDADGHLVDSTREAGSKTVVTPAAARRARHAVVIVDAGLGREDEPFRLLARPASSTDGAAVVVVGTSLESTNEAVDRVDDALVFGGIAVVLVAGFGAYVLAGAALRPVERMRRQAQMISERDASPQLEVPATRDELALLGETLNDLLERLHGALERERRFVADAGHELRTPLAVLLTELELASRRTRSRDELLAAIVAAHEETERIAHLTDELLFLAAADDGSQRAPRDRVQLAPVLEQAVTGMEDRASGGGVTLDLDVDPGLEAAVAPALVRRAVENLVENSLRYAPSGSRIAIRARRDAGGVVLEVLDDGPGFPEEFLPHAFERFRRADDARARDAGGTGLGLAIVLAVARAHGGTAVAANRPEGGAVVTVRFPAGT